MGACDNPRTAAMPACRDCARQKLDRYYTCAVEGYSLCPACFEERVERRHARKGIGDSRQPVAADEHNS